MQVHLRVLPTHLYARKDNNSNADTAICNPPRETVKMSDTVTIIDNRTGKQIECPVEEGVYGAPVINTRQLYGELGMFTYDPGFATTASCRSSITYLDGEEGVLM